MIKFFRTIRQRLLEKNNVSKYLLYAIGEIILVVMGILIALEINNRNEFRKDRLQERELLLQLQSEFKSNLDQLDSKIAIRDKMLSTSLKLIGFLDKTETINQDTIIAVIGFTTLTPTFDPITNDIISSGRIQYLQNPDLKERLSRWTSEVIQVTEEEESWAYYLQTRYGPFLENYIPTRSLVYHAWNNDIIELFQLDNRLMSDFELTDTKQKVAINKLLDDPKFENYIANCAYTSKMINIQSLALRERILVLLDLIEDELSH